MTAPTRVRDRLVWAPGGLRVCPHGHLDPRAARACALFSRAYLRWERIDARYRGTTLWSDDRAFRVWMDAGKLVNALFGLAMADRPEGRDRG